MPPELLNEASAWQAQDGVHWTLQIKGASSPQAESILRRHLSAHPTDEAAWTELLNVLAKEHRPSEVMRVSRRALEVFPDHPQAHSKCAIAMVEAGLQNEAVDLLGGFAKRVQAIPVQTALDLALICQASHPKRSMQLCRGILKQFPSHWEASCLLRSVQSRADKSGTESTVFVHVTYDWHVSIQSGVIFGLESLGIPFVWSPHAWASLLFPLKALVVCEMNPRLVAQLRLYAPKTPVVNIGHGVGVIGKNFIAYSSAASDHYCASSRWVGDQIVRSGLLDESRVWITGNPQMDPLFLSGHVRGAQKDLNRPTKKVLVTSTFNQEGNAALLLGDDPVQAVRGDDHNIAVMLNLHPHFRRLNPDLVQRWIQLASSVPNVTFHDSFTAITELMLEADVLISDFSSVATMFLACDRPIIRLIPESRSVSAAFQPDVFEPELCRSSVTLSCAKGLVGAIREALFSPEPQDRISARSALREKLFGGYMDGCSGLRVAQRIAAL